VPLLVDAMRRIGARGPFIAKIAGGASMFGALLPAGGINMGERNVVSTRQALHAHGIPTLGEDTGGDHGRSIYFHLSDGRVLVRSLKKGDRVL
jgi:chemotaxis protein CheD